MHRDKTVARILLMLSVVHVAAAAPAIVRQRSLDVDEDATAASEKRVYPGDTSQDFLPVSQMGNELPTASGIPPSQDDPSPQSGTAQLHNDHPQTSGPSPSQDDMSPVSKDSQSHNGPPERSNDLQSHDTPSQWRPPSGLSDGNSVHGESLSVSSQELDPVPQMNNDPPPASGASHDRPPVSGTTQPDNDPQPASGASQLHSPLALGTPQLHDHPLAASETSSVHDDLLSGPDAFDEEYRFNEVHYAPSSHESDTPLIEYHRIIDAPSSHELDTPPTNNHRISYAPWSQTPPTNHFISNEMKDKLKATAAVSVIGVTLFSFMYGLRTVTDHHSKHNGRDLTSSSDVVGRDVSTHPRPPRKLVSRALADFEE